MKCASRCFYCLCNAFWEQCSAPHSTKACSSVEQGLIELYIKPISCGTTSTFSQPKPWAHSSLRLYLRHGPLALPVKPNWPPGSSQSLETFYLWSVSSLFLDLHLYLLHSCLQILVRCHNYHEVVT